MDRAALIQAMEATATAAPVAVETEQWGTVYVRELTVAEVDAANEENEEAEAEGKDKNAIARGACRVLCDEAGQRIFDSKNEEDVALLAKQPWSLLRKVLKGVKKAVPEGKD